MALESTPPLRNIPSGTSLISRVRTASSRRVRHSAIHWSSVLCSKSVGWGASQYCLISKVGLLSQLQRKSVSGHELADAGKHRLLAAVVAEGQVLGQHLFVGLRRDLRVLKKRFDLRREGEETTVPEIVEGLDA